MADDFDSYFTRSMLLDRIRDYKHKLSAMQAKLDESIEKGVEDDGTIMYLRDELARAEESERGAIELYRSQINDLRKEIQSLKDENEEMKNRSVSFECSRREIGTDLEDREKTEKINEAIGLVTKMKVMREVLNSKLPELDSVDDVRRFKLDKGRDDLESQKEKLWELISAIVTLREYSSTFNVLPEKWSSSLNFARKTGLSLIDKISTYIENVEKKADEWNIREKNALGGLRRVNKPPPFDGKMLIYDWLKKFACYCTASATPVDQQGSVLLSLLEGPTRDLIEFEIPSELNPDCDQVKEILIREYGDQKNTLKSLMDCHKRIGQIPTYDSTYKNAKEIKKRTQHHLVILKSFESMHEYFSDRGMDYELLISMTFEDYLLCLEECLPANKQFDFLTEIRDKTNIGKLNVAMKFIKASFDLAKKKIMTTKPPSDEESDGETSASDDEPPQLVKGACKMQSHIDDFSDEY